MKLLFRPKPYTIGLAIAYLLVAPVPGDGQSGDATLGVFDACAGSCKPMGGWDCIHGTVHVENKCDPVAC